MNSLSYANSLLAVIDLPLYYPALNKLPVAVCPRLSENAQQFFVHWWVASSGSSQQILGYTSAGSSQGISPDQKGYRPGALPLDGRVYPVIPAGFSAVHHTSDPGACIYLRAIPILASTARLWAASLRPAGFYYLSVLPEAHSGTQHRKHTRTAPVFYATA